MQHLDPHERPPDGIRNVYKKYQKMKQHDLEKDADVVDLTNTDDEALPESVRIVREVDVDTLNSAFRAFAGSEADGTLLDQLPTSSIAVYEHENMPGLHIIPALLPPSIQLLLLSRLLHRDLSNPSHLTNIHTHYNLHYPPPSPSPSSSHPSFFSIPPSSQVPIATPLDPSVHKPLTTSHLLSKKIRWTTLGGQYNWTQKHYPPTQPPPFPPDIANLLHAIFPTTRAEAAIVNLYSPGDTLSVHRDVAETSSTGLVSVSLGCDAVFVIGTDDDRVVALRLRSGSAVYMSGASRFAWHGVPRIVGGTCAEELEGWPGGEWEGWMRGKRVNLNVRQMYD